MGGYGAFHYMLEKPDAFASVSGLSAAFGRIDNMTPEKLNEMAAKRRLEPLVGTPAENPAAYRAMDLYAGIRAALDTKTVLPPIYLDCGTEDFLLAESREMNDLLKSKGVTCEYVEAKGAHNWGYWKERCVGMLMFHWKHFHQIPPKESASH